MITGNKEKKIKKYQPTSHGDEIYGYVKAEPGFEIWGIPYGYHTENSAPFIEHRQAGVVFMTVNCSDVSVIVFDGV